MNKKRRNSIQLDPSKDNIHNPLLLSKLGEERDIKILHDLGGTEKLAYALSSDVKKGISSVSPEDLLKRKQMYSYNNRNSPFG